jgi:hypothetical protein
MLAVHLHRLQLLQTRHHLQEEHTISVLGLDIRPW